LKDWANDHLQNERRTIRMASVRGRRIRLLTIKSAFLPRTEKNIKKAF